MRYLTVAIAAILAIAAALYHLTRATHGLAFTHERVGTIPVTVFKPESAERAPVAVIAHGFAGSQQLMQPFAITLARNGYVAITFDFPGHGRNPTPLIGGLSDHDVRGRALTATLGAVVAWARRMPSSDGRLALIGHSMGSDIVVRYAQDDPDVAATVAVSLFFPRATASSPRNLLIIDGALEPAMLRDEGYRIVGMAAAGPAREGVTYGDFANGTARRLALADGVEHIGVLYSRESMTEALSWMNQAFGQRGLGFLDARGPWLGLLYLGLVALAWPLARWLPRVAPAPATPRMKYRWRPLLLVALTPALLTPLLLWQAPSRFLPLLLGDYLVLHFGLYGVLTAAGLWMVRAPVAHREPTSFSLWALILAALAATAYGTLAMGLPLNAFVTNVVPGTDRLPLILAMLCGTLPYFITDEWLTRSAAAPRGAYAVTKVCFLISLALAVALNLPKLFFLIIIVPAILILFIVYGLFSRWIYRRVRHPLVGALVNAITFAWFIAVSFPIVSG